jgi:hypothetical protein
MFFLQTQCEIIFDRIVNSDNPIYISTNVTIHNETGISIYDVNATLIKPMNFKTTVGPNRSQ